MKNFKTYVAEWERNAEKDAYWSVLTASEYEQKEWDKKIFFDSGKKELSLLQDYVKKIGISLDFRGEALDFGCGVGRMTRALGSAFHKVHGVDISAHMVQEAQSVLPSLPNVTYLHNPASNLKLFASEQFDFIYSNIVLQHIGTTYQRLYLAEFARIAKKKGWIVVQIPSTRVYRSIREKIKGKILAYIPYNIKKHILIHFFKNKSKSLNEFDFEINPQTEASVQRIASQNGLEIKHIAYTNSCDPDFCGKLTFKTLNEATRSSTYLSPMYFLQKK
jgi:ubiquinone/menaquinone biosynthesis C-methylase UbiE